MGPCALSDTRFPASQTHCVKQTRRKAKTEVPLLSGCDPPLCRGATLLSLDRGGLSEGSLPPRHIIARRTLGWNVELPVSRLETRIQEFVTSAIVGIQPTRTESVVFYCPSFSSSSSEERRRDRNPLRVVKARVNSSFKGRLHDAVNGNPGAVSLVGRAACRVSLARPPFQEASLLAPRQQQPFPPVV